MTGGTEASRRGGTKAAVPFREEIDGGPQPLHRHILRAQKHSSRWKTFSVSLQRMTDGPLRRRPSLSLPERERTWFRRLSETRALASLPRKRSGETKRGLPTPGVCESPIGCAPRFAAEHRAPARLSHQSLRKARTQESTNTGKHEHRKARTQGSQNRRGPMIRGPAEGEAGAWRAKPVPGGRSRCRSELSSQRRSLQRRASQANARERVPEGAAVSAPFLAGQKGDALGPSRKDEGTD